MNKASPRYAAWTLLTAGQRLQSPGQVFDWPTPLTSRFRPLRGHGLSQVLRPDPVKAAVWSEQREYPYLEGAFFPLDADPGGEALRRPLHLLQVTIPLLRAQAHQAGALQCREASPLTAVKELPMLRRGVPPFQG